MSERKIKPEDVSSYMKESLFEVGEEDINSIRRQLERTKDVVAAILTQLNTTQLLAIQTDLRGEPITWEDYARVDLTE